MKVEFTNLLIVTAIAFAAPLALGLLPRLRLPAVVLEDRAGHRGRPLWPGLGEDRHPREILALVGLAFLLFLAGLEIDVQRLRGRALRVAALGFALSFGIAVAAGLALKAGGLVKSPLLAAIILSATSLGVIVPVLKDSGELGSDFGQLVIAASSIADFGAIILLTLFFSGEGSTDACGAPSCC